MIAIVRACTYFCSISAIGTPQCFEERITACRTQFGEGTISTYNCDGICGLCDLCNTPQTTNVEECSTYCSSGVAKCKEVCENGKAICLACGVY